MTENFKYDVAFSFTAENENIATKLYELLKGRINCFIYFDKQKELAGNNGEEVFNSVFQIEARLVVIILSNTWGQTKWTKIEETAIRNRGFENGYDFAIVIPDKKDVSIPKWLPRNRIWINIERWNLESAAIAIETRVIEFDGQIKVESTIEKAKRLQTELEKTNANKSIINSTEGVVIYNAEVEKMNLYGIAKVHEFQNQLPSWNLRLLQHNEGGIVISSYNHSLIFYPIPYATNSADKAQIRLSILDGLFNANLTKADWSYEYRKIEETYYYFFINNFDEPCWKENQANKLFFYKDIINRYFDIFITTVSKTRKS